MVLIPAPWRATTWRATQWIRTERIPLCVVVIQLGVYTTPVVAGTLNKNKTAYTAMMAMMNGKENRERTRTNAWIVPATV